MAEQRDVEFLHRVRISTDDHGGFFVSNQGYG